MLRLLAVKNMSNLVENSFSFSLVFLDLHNDGFLCGARNPLRGNTNLYLCFPPLLTHVPFLRILKIVRNECGRLNSTDLCPWSAASCSKGLYGCNVRKIWCIVN